MKSLSPYNLPKISIEHISKQIQREIKEYLLKSKLSISGNNIELSTTKTKFNGLRYWLKCPSCKRPVQHLYLNNQLLCRKCSNLKYKYK